MIRIDVIIAIVETHSDDVELGKILREYINNNK